MFVGGCTHSYIESKHKPLYWKFPSLLVIKSKFESRNVAKVEILLHYYMINNCTKSKSCFCHSSPSYVFKIKVWGFDEKGFGWLISWETLHMTANITLIDCTYQYHPWAMDRFCLVYWSYTAVTQGPVVGPHANAKACWDEWSSSPSHGKSGMPVNIWRVWIHTPGFVMTSELWRWWWWLHKMSNSHVIVLTLLGIEPTTLQSQGGLCIASPLSWTWRELTTLWLSNVTGAVTRLRLRLIHDDVQLFLASGQQPIRLHALLFMTVLLCSVLHVERKETRGSSMLIRHWWCCHSCVCWASLSAVALWPFPSRTQLPIAS